MKNGFHKGNLFCSGNAGYSLVELIIVIAIMGIMVGITSLGVSMMFSRDAQNVASVIDDELSEARMMSMSKPGVHTMVLHCDADGKKTSVNGAGIPSGNYIKIQSTVTDDSGTDVTSEKVIMLKKDANIVFYAEGDTEPTSPTDKTLYITFDKANGSVKQFKVDASTLTGKKIYYIKCKAKNKEKLISIMDVTGRHTVK